MLLAGRFSRALAASSVLTGLLFSSAANAQQATLERIKRVGEIKVCLDQNNLPYSSDKADTPGFDTELAQEVAKNLGVKLVPFWYATNVGKRALRQMHGENNCDFFPGLPHDASFEDNNFKIALSKPYYVGGFATVGRADAADTLLADTKTKGVGVQMGTLPDFKLFEKGYERKLYKTAEEIADALEHKDIDAAVVAAPEGAWLAKSKAKSLKVLAGTEKEFLFPMSVGVRKADKDLLASIDDTIQKLDASGRMTEILAKYGMVRLYDSAGPAPAPAPAAAAPEAKPEASPEKKAEAAPAPAATAEKKTAEETAKAARPPLTASEALAARLEAGEIDRQRIEALRSAIRALQDPLRAEREALTIEKRKLQQDQAAFQAQVASHDALVGDQQFKKTLGVLEALKADGRKLPVVAYDGNPEATDLVIKGDLLATCFTNPHWGGGITAALAYHAAIGTFKPSKEPKEHREFYGPTIMVTAKDAAAFKAKYISATPKYNWKDFWGPSPGGIKSKA